MKRTVVKPIASFAGALLGLSLVACGGGGGGSSADAGTQPDADTSPLTGDFTHYVGNTLNVPDNQAESMALGLNIDGDPQNKIDNALGGLLAALGAQGLDTQSNIDASVTSGSLLLLHSIQADDLTADSSVGWQVFLGTAAAEPPAYDGTDTFTVDSTGPSDAKLRGSITGGQFTGGPGNITIQLALGEGAPIRVNLIGARIKANVTATSCTGGVLAGAVTKAEVDSAIIPAIAPLVNDSILSSDSVDGALVPCQTMADCPATSDSGSALECDDDARNLCLSDSSLTILNLLDANKDGTVTAAEIMSNSIVSALLAPDVDMLDANGDFNPRQDGTKDSISLGVGFTCVNATFDAPGE
jgi:hypothetical protein